MRRADGVEIHVLKTVKHFQTDSGEKLIETFMDLTERKKILNCNIKCVHRDFNRVRILTGLDSLGW